MHDMREAKKNAEIVIVIYHGGKEFSRYPSPRLRLLCHEMVECGADIVLTQHSHCIGCYEEYEGGHILYGQGNLHFVKPHSLEGWLTSLLVELEIGDTIKLNYYPMAQDPDTGGVKLTKNKEAEKIMNDFYARNEELKDGRWMDGWRAFCESVPDYKNIPSRVYKPESTEDNNEVFAHYLDCEAHTDVWREYFKTWHHTNEC